MKTALLSFLICFSSIYTITAQNEKNNWYFGQNAYVNFTSGSPVVGNGNLNTLEGCATVSNSSGVLLFYTDGITVYDSNGAVMPNGTGLKGNPSSTHAALVVPNPCDANIYYIFTTSEANQNGMYRYTVDLSLGTNGEIVLGSEFSMLPDATEKLASIKHANGVDFWITTTKENTGFVEVYSWLVDQTGVSTTPQIFTSTHPIGTNPGGTNGPPGNHPGQMKFNSSGTILAAAQLYYDREIDFFSFDPSTGLATSYLTSASLSSNGAIYGIEFSPNGNYLYATTYFTRQIWQFDITSLPGTPTIPAPNFIASIAANRGGSLLLSPDGLSIYVAREGANAIGQLTGINSTTSTYTNTGITLGAGTLSQRGLPTFISGTQAFGSSCLDLEPFQQGVPFLFSAAIETELDTDSFQGVDKEYGDIDNDGDIDILYTKNNALYVLINSAGPGNTPNYISAGVETFPGQGFLAFSYRFYDWNSDGWNDIVVLGTDPGGTSGIFLYLNNGAGLFPSISAMLLDGHLEFSFNPETLIAVGDLNNDAAPDIVISGQSAEVYGTFYFENTQSTTPYFTLPLPQDYDHTIALQMNNPFILQNNGSLPSPEIYDADCDGDLDLFISDPLFGGPPWGSARVFFHENNGGSTTNILPDVNSVGVINQYGFLDDLVTTDLECDWVVTRIVDYLGNGCPIAIAYNPCNQSFFYYDQDCSCEATLAVNEFETHVNEASISLYPNPASDTFSITSEMELHIDLVSIYNLQGRLIQTHSNINSEMNISELKTGLYIVQIEIEGKTISKKLIKK